MASNSYIQIATVPLSCENSCQALGKLRNRSNRVPPSPFIKRFETQNYRGLKNLAVDDISLVNLIGGLNGSGKTSFLEGIFTSLDVFNPLCVLRVLQWRGLPFSIKIFKDIVLSNQKSISFRLLDHQSHEYNTKIERLEVAPFGRSMIKGKDSVNIPQSNVSVESVRISFSSAGQDRLIRDFLESGNGININDIKNEHVELPLTFLLSRYTLNVQQDIAERYSSVVKSGRKSTLLEILRRLDLQVVDLEILQLNGTPVLHAQFHGAGFVPLSFAGDGVLSIMSASIAIIQAKDGILLLDEFDAAIHYSKLPILWEIVIELAMEVNCQIFSASHSKESIDAAVRAAQKMHANRYLRYFRFDNVEENRTQVTKYNFSELVVAVDEDWEVR